MKTKVLVVALLVLTGIVFAQKPGEELTRPETWRPIHPDEPTQSTLTERFALDSAVSDVAKVRTYLESFRTLTSASRRCLGAAGLRQIGNTAADLQSIGFKNVPSSIEGALLRQNAEIAKLQLDLATSKQAHGEASASDVKQRESNYRRALEQFKRFWDSHPITD